MLLLKVWQNLKLVVKLLTVEPIKLLEDLTRGHIDVMIGHVVVFVQHQVGQGGLPDQL